jgi:microcystin-dependent protein
VSSPFLAEIRIFPFNFAPKGWAFCAGQLMPISQNTALFSLLGTTFGGDGKSTFALPDMQGNVPVHWGQSTTGSQFFLGEESGSQFVSLLQTEIAAHSHTAKDVALGAATSNIPDATSLLAAANGGQAYAPAPANTFMSPQATSITGGGQPHNNMMPYLTLNFCIALQGIFPQRP